MTRPSVVPWADRVLHRPTRELPPPSDSAAKPRACSTNVLARVLGRVLDDGAEVVVGTVAVCGR
jgi:hypothetical protein